MVDEHGDLQSQVGSAIGLDGIAYHRRREEQERAAGGAATDTAVRRVHLDLADLHVQRARSAMDPYRQRGEKPAEVVRSSATPKDRVVAGTFAA